MAVLLVESFDWLDVGMSGVQLDVALGRKCTSHDVTWSTDGDTAAGIGGKGTAVRLAEATFHWLRWPLSAPAAATDEVGMGIWFKATGVGNSWVFGPLFGLIDDAGSVNHLNVKITADGFIQVLRGNVLLINTPVSLVKNEWNWLDMKTVVNSTTGSYTVRLNGTVIATDSGLSTSGGGTGSISFVQIQCPLNGIERGWYGGVIAWDDQGGSLSDFPTLPISFVTILADADGDDEEWTTSSGTDSYILINETAPRDDDSDYLESGTTGQRTLFTYDNVAAGFTDIHGIQINTVCRETDGTDYTLINTFKQNSILYPESSQAIAGQTYESLFNVLDQDPDTATAWTVSGINSLQAGIEVG